MYFVFFACARVMSCAPRGCHGDAPSHAHKAGFEKYNYGDSWAQYFATVTIGTPGSDFKLCMDTGSPHTWVPSIKCKSAGCSTLKKFDSALSTTYSVRLSVWLPSVKLDFSG